MDRTTTRNWSTKGKLLAAPKEICSELKKDFQRLAPTSRGPVQQWPGLDGDPGGASVQQGKGKLSFAKEDQGKSANVSERGIKSR